MQIFIFFWWREGCQLTPLTLLCVREHCYSPSNLDFDDIVCDKNMNLSLIRLADCIM